MPGIKEIANVWKNLKEVDLGPYRDSALQLVRLVIVGRSGSGRHTLADQLRRDPNHPTSTTQSTVLISDLNTTEGIETAELIILVMDAAATDYSLEQTLAKKWAGSGKPVLTWINTKELQENQLLILDSMGWGSERVLYGSAIDADFLQRELVPTVMELLPERHLALGRQFPLFRVSIAQRLINDACYSNAIYSISTGLAEVIPIFDLPLNLADMLVLTKAQAFLVYKLGLTLGFSTRWQDYVGEFGSVIGGGFVWRQMSRMLIGLIPVWGIVPKVMVAYSGTYVVGHVILQWYLTGRHLTRQQMSALSSQAIESGKKITQSILARLPHPTIPLKRLTLRAPRQNKACPTCEKPNAVDALFCQYCGRTFLPVPPEPKG